MTYPNKKIPNRYKTKQKYIEDHLLESFKKDSIVCDKPIKGGCSKKRPDWFIDCLTHSVVIECDEHQHIRNKCENKRIMHLFEDLANRPLVVIRFNPDHYIDKNNTKVYFLLTKMIKLKLKDVICKIDFGNNFLFLGVWGCEQNVVCVLQITPMLEHRV